MHLKKSSIFNTLGGCKAAFKEEGSAFWHFSVWKIHIHPKQERHRELDRCGLLTHKNRKEDLPVLPLLRTVQGKKPLSEVRGGGADSMSPVVKPEQGLHRIHTKFF